MLNLLFYTQDFSLIHKTNFISQTIGCKIFVAQNRKEAINYVCNNQVVLCLIDLENDGEGFSAALKLIDDNLPTLILSSDASEANKLRAFDKGCDDFISKSISDKELQFRIQSILRRTLRKSDSYINSSGQLMGPITIGNSVVDFAKRCFYSNEENIPLSKKEASLLQLFYLNRGKLLKREDILKEIWNTNDYYASKSMDVYLSKLRKILIRDESVSIQNIHGTGYMFIESDN